MPGKQTPTFDTACEIGLALPGVERGMAYGTSALKLNGTILAVVPTNKQAEPGSLGIRVDFEQRAALVAEAPEKYYVKEHYAAYPIVLVRLDRIDVSELRDLIGMAYRYTASHPSKSAARKKRSTKTKR